VPRILIVDDDETMRELLRESLKEEYEIVDTGDPQNALVMALEHKPDVILLDLSMPGLSGFELCQALSSLSFTRHIPIFIVSAEDRRNKAFAESLGASEYFQKPVNFELLKARVEVALHPKGPERRLEVRFQLRVTLKLVGKHKDGKPFEMHATTDDMSAGGFLCSCTTPLELGTTVEVFLCRGGDHHLGTARAVRMEPSDSSHPRYGFAFAKKINLPVS
jgi:DNA-binding response OmpR family regulator